MRSREAIEPVAATHQVLLMPAISTITGHTR
jgi:hypothetical protein